MNPIKSYMQWAEKSRLRYILMVGVAYWGTTTAILSCLIMYAVGDRFMLRHLIVLFGLLWIGGIFFGLRMWYAVVRKRNSSAERAGITDIGN